MIQAIAQRFPAQFTLTQQQTVKIVAIAIAALVCFGASYALLCIATTFLCETMLRGDADQQNWFSTRHFSMENIGSDLGAAFIGRIVIVVTWVALSALGLVVAIPNAPVQIKLAEMVLINPIRFLFKCIIVAPICEEILFRGFLQERFEDVAQLFHRHIYPIPHQLCQKMANVAQAILFGYAHITHDQVVPSAKWVIALATGWMGYVFGSRKNQSGTLLEPIAEHSINNTIGSAALLYKQFASS